MCGADTAPMALIYREHYNKVTCTSVKTADTMASAVFAIHRLIQGEWAAPYAVGVVQAPPATCLGASDFKEAMACFHDDKVSFVSVHGITTAMVLGIKAHMLLCNPLWRGTHADTAVADIMEVWTL